MGDAARKIPPHCDRSQTLVQEHDERRGRIAVDAPIFDIERTAVDEGASFGAALLGGVAAGAFADVHAAVAACVRPGEIIEPVEAWIEPYREARERFVALYPALRDVR